MSIESSPISTPILIIPFTISYSVSLCQKFLVENSLEGCHTGYTVCMMSYTKQAMGLTDVIVQVDYECVQSNTSSP